ncbi:DUF6891 domain-containing protein [Kitasatospora nipponensis]
MLAITVTTETGPPRARITADDLAALVRRIGGAGDTFLIAERLPDQPDVYVQVLRTTAGDYQLEHRDGAPERHYQVMLDGPEPVIAAMTGWARRREGWDAGLAWERLDLGPAVAESSDADPDLPPGLDEDEWQELTEHVGTLLAGGYATRAELAEAAEEYLATDDERPLSPAQAWQLADRLWRERLAEQAGWEGETDPERLARAFEALRKAGITAEENFTCCRTCGQAEIGAAGSPDARGFVYFHSQCTDSAVAGNGLTLLYGGFDGSAETTRAIGHEVAAVLREHGLPVEWSGDPERAITLTPLAWCRRLVG